MTTASLSTPIARKLRRNQTDAEKHLWSKLRNNQTGYKFKRQYPIEPYIVDFFCLEQKLIIELDGGQHTEEKDQKRTLFLTAQGYRVLRFWNNEVMVNLASVMQTLVAALSPSPQPSPEGEGAIKP